MQERIQKVLKLVEEGKLSAEDAQDIILGLTQGASSQNGHTEPPTPPEPEVIKEYVSSPEDRQADAQEAPEAESPPPPPIEAIRGGSAPFSNFSDAIDKIGKDLGNVNWNKVGEQIKDGAQKGVELIKQTADKARDGKLGMLFGEIEKREIILSIGTSSEKQIVIENYSGDVKIFGSAAESKLIARGSFKAENRVDAERKAEEYSIMIEESDSSILIRQPDVHNTSIDLEIHLTESGPINIRTSNGDVTIQGTRSNVNSQTASGDTKVDDHEGNLELNTANGDVSIRKVNSNLLTIATQSGDISANETAGNHNLRTASGCISVTQGTGRTLAIDAASGDISVAWAEPVSGNFNVRTVSGDVSFMIPSGSDCRVGLSTIRGVVMADLHLESAHREECRISGVLGDGAGNLDLSAVSGNVSLRESH